MKRFLTQLGLYMLLIVLALYTSDFVYTLIYTTSKDRNKIEFVMNSSARHYNVIVIGSSRAENHIVTKMFEEQGLSAYNLGMSGANLSETSLLLKLFFQKGNTADKILLQLDLNFQDEQPAEGIMALYLPYLPINKTIANHYSDARNALAMRYVPFYRYGIFDSKIGLREIMLSLAGKKSHLMKTGGYMALSGELTSKEKFILPEKTRKKNKYYTEITQTCKQNNSQLIAFAAPFCRYLINERFFADLKQRIPELHDYSAVIPDDSCFHSCGHMNEKGARRFTEFIIKQHFNTANPDRN